MEGNGLSDGSVLSRDAALSASEVRSRRLSSAIRTLCQPQRLDSKVSTYFEKDKKDSVGINHRKRDSCSQSNLIEDHHHRHPQPLIP